jgi:hypothetical protein
MIRREKTGRGKLQFGGAVYRTGGTGIRRDSSKRWWGGFWSEKYTRYA